MLDLTFRGEHVGCEELALAIARVRPKLHIFGHVHESHGTARVGPTLHVNASICTLSYVPANAPILVDFEGERAVVVEP